MKRIEHKRLAVLLRIGLVIAALVCAAIFFWFLPEQGRGIARTAPEFAWAFWPCLVFAWLFAAPVFLGDGPDVACVWPHRAGRSVLRRQRPGHAHGGMAGVF